MKPVKLLIGGSPCTHWSIAQGKNRETTAEGLGWELFKNYLIAKEKYKPDFFLYENNKSAASSIKTQISHELGVDLQYINSALVSAQNRERFYAHNFGDVPQPQDRGILLKDILDQDPQGGLVSPYQDKSHCITASHGKAVIWNSLERHQRTMIPIRIGATPDQRGEVSNYAIPTTEGALGKSPVYRVIDGQVWIKEKAYPIKLPDGHYIIRPLTVTEVARLQTMPDNYCRAVSKEQGYRGLGNGWTAEVIIHLLAHGLGGIARNTPVEVLSMYDGIGTGRYCLDKLGFANVTYYAYEIEKSAIQIAMSNYRDIKQCGDAFDVRKKGWFLTA